MNNILGLNVGLTNTGVKLKDGASTLISDGHIVSSIAEERITRKKHDNGFYNSMEFILSQNNLLLSDIDGFVVSTLGEKTNLQASQIKYLDKLIDKNGDNNIVVIPSHHLSHAYSVFPLSPYKEAIIVVADMEGSIIGDDNANNHWENALERVSYFLGKKTEHGIEISLIDRDFDRPDEVGIGEMYGIFTHFLGFESYVNSGKTMGLASYGNLDRFKKLQLFDYDKEGKPFSLIPNDYFNSNDSIQTFFHKNGHTDIHTKTPETPFTDIHKDIAFFVQNELERIMLKRIEDQVKKFGYRVKNICLAGGVALNCVLNSKIKNQSYIDDVYLQPACGDTGQSLGNAIYGDLHFSNRSGEHDYNFSPYLGGEYSDAEILEALNNFNFGVQYIKENLCDVVANLISKDKIVGWFQGKSEIGPRALGNRSILANPLSVNMKDTINLKVKHREEFRPFAPIALKEYAGEYFDEKADSKFMLFAPKVLDNKQSIIPSVTHIDGSARLQTVNKEQNSLIYEVINSFKKITGVPILLNTSLNDGGDPLVENPKDALECFAKTGMDYIVIGNYLIYKK